MLISTLYCLWNFSGPVLGIPAITFWPWVAGAVTLVLGLAFLPRQEIRSAHGLDKLIFFGPTLVAIAMAIFGADHFVTIKFVTMIVPKWMPWRMFWAYFVGLALIASALSLTTKVYWRLAASMLGGMLFLFVVLLHIPNFIRDPHLGVIHTLLLRDMAIGSGIVSFGVAQKTWGPRVIGVMRYLFAFPIACFGFLHFWHPALAPGFPQDDPDVVITLPAWIPAHAMCAYLTGLIFIACAIALTSKRYARFAAKTLGLTVLVWVFFAYLPRTIEKASSVAGGLNYLAIHCALAGSALMLAGSVPTRCNETTSNAEELQGVGISR